MGTFLKTKESFYGHGAEIGASPARSPIPNTWETPRVGCRTDAKSGVFPFYSGYVLLYPPALYLFSFPEQNKKGNLRRQRQPASAEPRTGKDG